MANRRTLKRSIRLVCTELWAECVAVSLYASKPNETNVEALLHSIVKLESEYINRISHVEPGLKPKAYFKDLRDKFVGHASDLADQINNM